MSTSLPRVVAILPRVRIQEHGAPHNDHCKVGPATIWRDTDALWPTQLQRLRPSWLRIFREFPQVAIEREDRSSDATQSENKFEVPDCSYGSVIACEDSDWLRKNLDHLVSVIYFLAEPTGDFVRPAECFEFFTLNPDAGQNDLVGLFTKTGEKIESASSLILTPSLPLRADNRTATLRLDLDYCQELVKCFEFDPNDRLVVACRHFFRASFEGIFQSPWEQDVAAYCACLEAAFDIPEGKYKEALMDAAEELLGKNSELRDLIAGAYVIRSVLNHGAIAVEGDERTKFLKKFRKYSAINLQTLRHICAFAIQETLLDSAEASRTEVDRAMRNAFNHDIKRIDQRFHSDVLWKELANRFADKDAAKAIAQLDLVGEGECIDFCCRFQNAHCWTLSTERPTPKKFLDVLRTTACIFGKKAKAAGETDLDDRGISLYNAVRNKQMEELNKWLHDNAPLQDNTAPDTLHAAIYTATIQFSMLLNEPSYKAEVVSYWSTNINASPEAPK